MYVATGLSKSYGGIHALRGVDLTVRSGEVHALLGANGAGKSTLVKTMVGVHRATSGQLVLDGQEVNFSSVHDAGRNGVAYVSQELSLFGHLDVLSNLFSLREPTRWGLVSRRAMRSAAQPVLEMVGLDASLDASVGNLRLGEQQLVEIARALLHKPKVLVLDEPTSSLQADETARMLDVIRLLRAADVAILYVSHFLEEVFSIADAITILRNGEKVGDRLAPSDSTIVDVARLITGAELAAETPRSSRPPPAPEAGSKQLTVREVSVKGRISSVSLSARSGEIVGLAGLEGAGHQTLLSVIAGARPSSAGQVTLPDGMVVKANVSRAVRGGVACVVGDRRRGLLLDKTVWENIAMVSGLAKQGSGWIWSARRHEAAALTWIARLGIGGAEPSTKVGALSGGNQQKVLLAMWLAARPQVVLLEDPTRGVDVGAKAEIHRLVADIARDGRVVLVSSSETEELASICDRVIVFFRGAIRGELSGSELTAHQLLAAINTPPLPQA